MSPTLAETLAAEARDTPRYELPADAERKPGRPRKYAPWFEKVAQTMRDGTTLEMALVWNGIILSKEERRKLYRNLEFRRLYRLERQLYMYNEYGKRSPTELERIRKNLERQIR